MDKAYIKGISYYLPSKVLTNDNLVQEFPEWSVDKVSKKIGVNQRHIADGDETACDLAEKAALALFKEYEISPATIDFVLLCTQSPDYILPTTACILQDRLGIRKSSGALDFNLGCSGCIYGLAMAKGLIVSHIASNILLITSETYSKYLHPRDKSNRSIFGDGAAACLISTSGIAEIGDFILGTDGSGADNLIIKTGAARFPKPSGYKDIDVEGHVKYDDFLYMNGGNVFNFTLDVVPPMVKDIMLKNELDKVDYYVFHQANKFMLSTIRKVCQIPKDIFYIDLENCGNTVSSTVLIGLKESIKNGSIVDGMNVMICGFGVGLSWGGTVLRF